MVIPLQLRQDFQSYNRFGAHEVEPGKWSFLVWAPHAQQVKVEGDFNDWQGSPLKLQGTTGCWYGELAAEKNQLYKYRIIGPDGIAHEKMIHTGLGLNASQAVRLSWSMCRVLLGMMKIG